MAVLGLRFCARAFSSCGKRGPLFIAARRPLTVAASPVAEHRLQTRRLSNCGPRSQLLRGMWDLPRPGLEPASPALAGRPSTTAPPGKPRLLILNRIMGPVSIYFLAPLLRFSVFIVLKYWLCTLSLHDKVRGVQTLLKLDSQVIYGGRVQEGVLAGMEMEIGQ